MPTNICTLCNGLTQKRAIDTYGCCASCHKAKIQIDKQKQCLSSKNQSTNNDASKNQKNKKLYIQIPPKHHCTGPYGSYSHLS